MSTASDTYDFSGPPVGFVLAARAGDLTAIQAAADWYRDRGQLSHPDKSRLHPSDEEAACLVEVYKTEMEIRMAQGRLLHTLLPKLQPFVTGQRLARRASPDSIRDVLSNCGCGFVLVCSPQRDLPPPHPYRLICPTDYTEQERARQTLTAILQSRFPRIALVIEFENVTLSHAGSQGQRAFECETYTDDE